MGVNRSKEQNTEREELVPSCLQKGNKSLISNKETKAMSTYVPSYENVDYNDYHFNLLSSLKNKSSQFYPTPGPEFETLGNKYEDIVVDNPHSNSECTNFLNNLPCVGESGPTKVGLSFGDFDSGVKNDGDCKISSNYTEYKGVSTNKFKCDICNYSVNSISRLDEHNLTSHTVSVDVECDQCHNIFQNKKLLLNHKRCCENRTKSSVTGYVCAECGILLKSRQSLNRHEKRFHLQIDRNLMCDVCGKTFKFKNHLTYHKSFMHPDDKDKVTCDICRKEFLCQIRLNKHMRSTHCSIRKYICGICHKSFKDKKTLDVHITVHSAEKGFKCDVCQLAFRTKYKLKIHLTSHTNDRFKCENCSKLFVLKKNYESHVQNCNRKKSQHYTCDICDKDIQNQSQFNLHMKFHINPNIDLFMCDLCGKLFESKVKCEKHRFYHDIDNKSLYCSICSKTFKNNKILKNHMFLHTSDAFLYKCETCGKPFKHSGAFHSHQRVHKNEIHYECSWCYEKFKWKQTYDKHILKCYKANKNEPSTSKLSS